MNELNPVYHYTCHKTNELMKIDGNLIENSWIKCPKSPIFGDIVDGNPGWYQTKAALLWDNKNLYVSFWIQEPYIVAKKTERDSRIYLENDIEVFISGKDCYYEFQINALGTIYEVFYIYQDKFFTNSFDKLDEFQFKENYVDIFGGFQDVSRFKDDKSQIKWAFRNWDFPGLKAKVQIQGTLNDNTDIDNGWTVELAFPWKGMEKLNLDQIFPPKEGDILRMDFSRFEKLFSNGIELNPHPGWTWSPHGVYDSHLTDKFTYIHFTEDLLK